MTHFQTHSALETCYTRWHWGLVLIVPIILATAGCGGSTAKVTKTSTPVATTSVGNPTPVTTAPTAVAPGITPIAGTYSIYVDPKFGYSFEYPSDWTPRPAQGTGWPANTAESNVVVTEPYTVDATHPQVVLLIRASALRTDGNLNADFIQKWVCSGLNKNAIVASYPAYNGDSYGGYPKEGYEAPKMLRSFAAKGIGFEIILQGSPRDSYAIDSFFRIERPNFQHVIDTFSIGNGVTPPGTC